MLRIKDQSGKTKYILRDEDEEPVEIEELVLNDDNEDEEGEENATDED